MASEEPEDFSKLPLDVKLNHKVYLLLATYTNVQNTGSMYDRLL